VVVVVVEALLQAAHDSRVSGLARYITIDGPRLLRSHKVGFILHPIRSHGIFQLIRSEYDLESHGVLGYFAVYTNLTIGVLHLE
jgi:hypothetical protein